MAGNITKKEHNMMKKERRRLKGKAVKNYKNARVQKKRKPHALKKKDRQ